MRCEEAGILLCDLLEEKLSSEARESVSQHLARCSQCQTDLQQLQQWQISSRQWKDEAVPEWNRRLSSTPFAPRLHWFNWASLAAASFSVLIVLTQLRITHDQNGTHIAFGASPQKSSISADELELRFADFEKRQQDHFEQRFVAYQLERAEQDKKLLTAALTYTREQQRDDMSKLVDYWQNTREQDLSTQTIALRRLFSAQQTELNTLKASIRREHPSEEL